MQTNHCIDESLESSEVKPMKKSCGFTLVETLCVCIILSVLASLRMPALFGAIRAAHVSSDLSRLRQLHVAFSLYRTEWDGDGKYGTATARGLPDYFALTGGTWRTVEPNPDMWKSSCGLHPDNIAQKDDVVQFVYPPCDKELGCGDYYRRFGDSSMLVVDTQCVDPASPFASPFHSKLVVVIRLNGQAKTMMTKEPPDSLAMWHPKEGRR